MPAGMTQVAIAASTISANRIVYADGSVNRLFFSGSGTEVSVSLICGSCSDAAAQRRWGRDEMVARGTGPVITRFG